MTCHKFPALIATVVLCRYGLCRTAAAQAGRGVDAPGRVTELTAEALGKHFAPDTPESVNAYQGRVLRVSGRVTMAHKPYVYLGTGSNFPTGQPVLVTLDDKAGLMPEVSVGDGVVAEGRLDRAGIFGPILTECRLVRRERDGKAPPGEPGASASPRGGGGVKGRSSRKAAEKTPRDAADPRAVALRFDGPVREGQTGYRPRFTSFRLRFGPGKWRGTVIGRSIAWGDGNQNQDHWGVGSGEVTFTSDVHEDADGAYFVFSLNGTDWESDRVAALFRLTLPDGTSGVATALIPVVRGR